MKQTFLGYWASVSRAYSCLRHSPFADFPDLTSNISMIFPEISKVTTFSAFTVTDYFRIKLRDLNKRPSVFLWILWDDHQLSITCSLCKHHTMPEVANLIAVVGGDTTAHEARKRARCHNCGTVAWRVTTGIRSSTRAAQALLWMALVLARESHFA